MRGLLQACGWSSFALGGLGLLLPGLPTTIFWIVAVWCWTRSAPHLVQNLLAHPRVGPGLRAYLEHRVIRPAGKLAAGLGIALSYLLWLSSGPAGGTALAVAAAATALIWWLARHPGNPPAAEESWLGAEAWITPLPWQAPVPETRP